MPNLATSLQGFDLGHLKIIAEQWGVELRAPDAPTARKQLVPLMLDADLLLEIVETLPEEAQPAMYSLQAAGGRMPWPVFARRFGDIREMGPGKRDRERPDLHPASPSEALFYHGLISRDFFDTQDGPQEFAYIPADLLALLPDSARNENSPIGRPATPVEHALPTLANDWILDDACTMLAWLRSRFASEKPDTEELLAFRWAIKFHHPAALYALLQTTDLVDATGQVNTEMVKLFLESNRGEALLQLAQSWQHALNFNELRLVPNLICEGAWENDPLRTREIVLEMLDNIPLGTWWSLPGFVAGVRSRAPDFQRPAGDYDTWYIRDARTGVYLKGFENWEAIDGALLHFIITGPLTWLGCVELAATSENSPITAFRRTHWWDPLINGQAPQGLAQEDETFLISSDARLRVPRLVPRPARYQIARFADWEEAAADGYRYRITPASLERAQQQGLVIGQLIAILRRFALTVPPSLVRALERWETRGVEARLVQMLILRLSTPEMLQLVRESRAARFLGDPLGPTTIEVRANAAEKVLRVLAELGYLGEAALSPPETTDQMPPSESQ
jgi:hypothetical protein